MSFRPLSQSATKLSHKQFRALLKKFRRKKKRQLLAQERDNQEMLNKKKRENSPTYKEQEEDRRRNSQLYEEFEERERLRRHKEWLYREQLAQIQFRKKQEQLEVEKQRREEERKRILEEFEKQQNLENKLEEKNKKIKSQKEETLQEALANLPEDGPWHNPIAPDNYNTRQDKDQCQFFEKTGCCRFGDSCKRVHNSPDVSTTILIKGMFTHFSIDHTGRDDYDTDMALEYEDRETYDDFKNFYNDVLPEFKKFGKVLQFKVCNNHEPHLRGNVYVQYSREKEAFDAYQTFNARYYAGKQLTCNFTHVIKWRSAICGLYFRKQCPKGDNCNFLHVFKNPSNEYWEADRDLPARDTEHSSSHSNRSYRSREHSDRYSSRRNYSYDYHRDDYEDRHPKYHRRSSSSESNSDDEKSNHFKSSRHRHKALDESSRSYHKHKHRDSKARSHSPQYSPEDSETHKKSKKSKHKKKKKKRNKRESSEEEED